MAYENFPYTNIHELNLDWLLSEMKRLQESAVMSVNGQTGDVILYQDKDIVFPAVDDPSWSMMRTANGQEVGILFQNGVMYVKSGNSVSQVYTGDNPPSYPVSSVNGQTGAVITYQENLVRLPDVTESVWNLRRIVDKDGTPNSQGIQFEQGQAPVHIDGTNRYPIYTGNNPPPYPVSSVNGQTGAVVIAIPVQSVNGQTGAVTLYQDHNTRLPDVDDDDWNIHRIVDADGTPNSQGIQFEKGQPMKHIDGVNRYPVYTSNNPPPYPVTQVNGQTGNVSIDLPFVSNTPSILESSHDSTTVKAGVKRGVSNGTVTLELNTTGDTIKGYLKFISSDESVNESFQILTTNEIPSGSGVLSINGLTGVVQIYGTDLRISNNINQSIKTYVDNSFANLQDLIASEFDDTFDYYPGSYCIHNGNLYRAETYVTAGPWTAADWSITDVANQLYYKADQLGLAWVEDEDTAQHNIPSGHLVYFSGIMCRATQAISIGDTLTVGTNLSMYDENNELYSGKGALNALNDQIGTVEQYGDYDIIASNITTGTISNLDLGKYRYICIFMLFDGNPPVLIDELTMPIDLFKVNRLQTYFYDGTMRYAYIQYVSNSSISVTSDNVSGNYHAYVIGIK